MVQPHHVPSPVPAPAAQDGQHALLVVLDSNIWLDMLVFDDPHVRPIRAALERGTLRALIDARCLHELAHVLDYPQFAPRKVDKSAALDTVARLAQQVAPLPAEPARPLPQCKDREDQKFLELAHATGAAWLISKDRAVLRLAKRTARDFGFRIAPPEVFNTLLCDLDRSSPCEQKGGS
jgi:putative PIN family toxin of toxin-antitoxin system